jgi:hypothetical protein
MTAAAPPKSGWRWLEWAFAIATLTLIGRALWFLQEWGYLPQPFFFEPSDTYMDWFNTAYWAHDPGPYDTWGTLYPPLSFVILRLLGIPHCYAGAEGLPARDCDWVGIVVIHGFFVINAILIALTYMKIDRTTAAQRSIALAAGMPMLYALDRGNILLLCFTCMLLAYGPLLHKTRWRWLFAGLAVNFKVYLIAPIAAQLLRRRWVWFEGAMIAAVLIYVATYLILGSGTPMEIYRNIRDFTEGWVAANATDIWYAATYKPLLSLLSGNFPLSSLIGSDMVEGGLIVLPALVHLGQAAIVLAAIATWLRPEVVPPHRVAFLGTAMALISSEAGGYTYILGILLVFMERWRGVARPLAILCCYLLCLPGDIPLGQFATLYRESFLTSAQVEVKLSVGLGMILRPGLLLIATMALSSATIHDVWIDIRDQGWKTRWRFRRDARLLPTAERPEPS